MAAGNLPPACKAEIAAGTVKDALPNTGSDASAYMYTMETPAPTLVIGTEQRVGMSDRVETRIEPIAPAVQRPLKHGQWP